ncbi:MAG: putative DNA binding domain-containing protein [Bacilli bacterium]|jgi:ATP-dependent DNA helicase RecG|nr:putative DNA binding domain-containing protein [Bacilli bacterium]
MDNLSAILNKHVGGVLYLGVKPNGDFCGQQIGKETLNHVATFIKTAIKPMIYPTIELKILDGLPIVKVTFNGTEIPYSSYGRYFKRVVDRSEEMLPHELKTAMFNSDYSSAWENNLTTHPTDDVDLNALQKFYEQSISSGRLEPMDSYDPSKLLQLLGLAENGFLNNAGFYLFSKSSPVVLKMAVYATDERINFIDINRVEDNIYNLIDTGMGYVKAHINWSVSYSGKSAAREENPEIPVEALREIVVNAFAHANYRGDTEHEIDITPSVVEIYNPGEFPNNLKPEDFLEEQLPSIPRNRKILNVLYRCKDVEIQGTGIRKALRLCQVNGIKTDYVDGNMGFRFVFHRKNVTQNVTVKLSKTDLLVVKVLREHPEYTREEISKVLKKNLRTIQRSINHLKAAGRIVRIGSDKAGYWEILENTPVA